MCRKANTMDEEVKLPGIAEIQTRKTESGPRDDQEINRLLKEGWVLLDVRVTQTRTEDFSHGYVIWVLGRPKE